MPVAGSHPSKSHSRAIVEANRRRRWSRASRNKISRATKKQMKSKIKRFEAGSANRGKHTWNRGKHWPLKIRRKLSRALKGHIPAFAGKSHSLKVRKKISMSLRGRTIPIRVRRKISRSHKRSPIAWASLRKNRRSAIQCPNLLEKAMMKILKSLHLKYKFQEPVDKLTPDFVVCGGGRRFVFEADGSYWHRNRKRKKVRDQYLRRRGYSVHHFTEKKIKKTPRVVADKVIELLEKK